MITGKYYYRTLCLIFGFVLITAGCFAFISLLVFLFSLGEDGVLFSLGTLLFNTFGFSSFLIPVFFLTASVMLFIPGWSMVRGGYLIFFLVPFFTIFAGEKLSGIYPPHPLVEFFTPKGIVILSILLGVLEYAALYFIINFPVWRKRDLPADSEEGGAEPEIGDTVLQKDSASPDENAGYQDSFVSGEDSFIPEKNEETGGMEESGKKYRPMTATLQKLKDLLGFETDTTRQEEELIEDLTNYVAPPNRTIQFIDIDPPVSEPAQVQTQKKERHKHFPAQIDQEIAPTSWENIKVPDARIIVQWETQYEHMNTYTCVVNEELKVVVEALDDMFWQNNAYINGETMMVETCLQFLSINDPQYKQGVQRIQAYTCAMDAASNFLTSQGKSYKMFPEGYTPERIKRAVIRDDGLLTYMSGSTSWPTPGDFINTYSNEFIAIPINEINYLDDLNAIIGVFIISEIGSPDIQHWVTIVFQGTDSVYYDTSRIDINNETNKPIQQWKVAQLICRKNKVFNMNSYQDIAKYTNQRRWALQFKDQTQQATAEVQEPTQAQETEQVPIPNTVVQALNQIPDPEQVPAQVTDAEEGSVPERYSLKDLGAVEEKTGFLLTLQRDTSYERNKKEAVRDYRNKVTRFWRGVWEALLYLREENDSETELEFNNPEENVSERAPWSAEMDYSLYLYWKSFQEDKARSLRIPFPEMIAWDFAMNNNFTNLEIDHPLTPQQVYSRMVELGLDTDQPWSVDLLEELIPILKARQPVPDDLAHQLQMRTSGLYEENTGEVFPEHFTDPITDSYGGPFTDPSSDLFDCPIPQDYVNILLRINLE